MAGISPWAALALPAVGLMLAFEYYHDQNRAAEVLAGLLAALVVGYLFGAIFGMDWRDKQSQAAQDADSESSAVPGSRFTQPETEEAKSLQEARAWIWELANRDCDCDITDGYPTDPSNCCDTCRARLALRELNMALSPQLISYSPERTKDSRERAWVEYWREQNQQIGLPEDSVGLLRAILLTDEQMRANSAKPSLLQERYLHADVSQRDAMVATSVIQWMGTNCGYGFIEEARKRSKEKHSSAKGHFYNVPPDQQTAFFEKRQLGMQSEVMEFAELIAKNHICYDKYPQACENLQKAIVNMFFQFRKKYLNDKVEI